jgi:hypothetical protein
MNRLALFRICIIQTSGGGVVVVLVVGKSGEGEAILWQIAVQENHLDSLGEGHRSFFGRRDRPQVSFHVCDRSIGFLPLASLAGLRLLHIDAA